MPVLKVNGIDLNYVDQGEGDVLLMIHNVISNIETYSYNLPELAKHFRVIACDLRGHGKTTHLETESRDEAKAFYNFDALSDDIYQLLSHLGVKKCFVLGQAYWGVNTAMTFFYHHPEMVRAVVAATCQMISSDTGSPNDTLDDKTRLQFERMHDLARSKGMMAVYEERKTLRTFWSESLLNNEDIMDRFAKMYAESSPTAFLNFPSLSHERRAATASQLRETATPVMVLLGVEDSHNDNVIRDMRHDIPDCHVVILPNCGHYPAIENPRDFNRAVANFFSGIQKQTG